MGGQGRVYLSRNNLFSAAVNHLFKAPSYKDVSRFIQTAEITSAKPTIPKSSSVGIGVVRVPREDSGAAHCNFAFSVVWKKLSGIVHDANLEPARTSY